MTAKDRRNNFLRRTKATSPPDTTDTDVATTDNVEATTSKYTRRGGSKFKSRKEIEKAGKESEKAGNDRAKEDGVRRPSLNGGARRTERPTRTFVRRKLGGANSTATSTTAASTATSAATRRPFRVASRRRPLPTTAAPTTVPPSTAVPTTTISQATDFLASEEYLQDIGDTDIIEDPTLEPNVPTPKKTVKIQRRPLVNLREEAGDQKPSATNEEERKRQSKKYSSSFKQNQLDEKLRQRAKSQEESEDTTERKTTLADDFTAETAVAIAAHQLLAAPIPILPDYEEVKTTKKSYTQSTQYFTRTETDPKGDSKTVYFEEFTSTPVYKTSSPDYVTTGRVFDGFSTEFDAPKVSTFSVPKSTTFRTSTFAAEEIRPPPSPTPTIINTGLSGVASTSSIFTRVSPTDSGVSRVPITSPVIPSVSPVVSSSPRFLGAKNPILVPVEDYQFSTREYSGASQEPTYFTREYLLESPVTKTYDEEYQYLAPVTTPQTTTRRPFRKKVNRRISTTIRPTTPAYVPPATTAKPRRVPAKAKPFEKVKPVPNRTYRPIENYDYYDDSEEKVAEKYLEETKVILHRKGNIECLDIGNFPHPTSCKKFISCARIENGSIFGWEYICPKGLSFDPVGSICNWSAGLGCDEKDI
ncbi:hypothetical protein evm_000867 [Chilo suppressalis]|nr:hypothetical protein evm_000867 [Chilo suppressalis]